MEPSAQTAAARTAGKTVAALFDAHARMVLGLCRAVLRDPDDAEDAAQQTFLSAYRALLGGTRPMDAAAWLATIARNECRQRISRRLATPAAAPLLHEIAAPASGEPAEQAGQRAEVAAVASAVGKLPERQREAIVLRDFYGLSYEEVATAMSVSLPAVESLLSRARRRLADRVGTMRTSGVLVVPASLQEQLARLIPDFGPAATPVAAGGGAAALLTKLAATPVATKAAAAAAIAAVAVGAEVAIQHRDGAGAQQQQRETLAPASLLPQANIERRAGVPQRRVVRPRMRSVTAARGHAGSSGPSQTSHGSSAPRQSDSPDHGGLHEEEEHEATPSAGGSGNSGSGDAISSGSFGADSSGPSDSSGSSGSGSSGSSDSGTSGSSSSGTSDSSGSGTSGSSGSGMSGSSGSGDSTDSSSGPGSRSSSGSSGSGSADSTHD